jgi:nitrogen fixation protein FixH
MTAQTSGPRPSDRFIPYYFVAFFVVLTILLGNFAWIAVRGNPGVVADHAYEVGVAYNKMLRTAAAQEALGWKSALDVTPTADAKFETAFTLHDASGHAIDNAEAKVIFKRPTMSQFDQTVALKHQTDGRYTALVDLPAHGVWQVYAAARSDGHEFQIMRRIVLQ